MKRPKKTNKAVITPCFLLARCCCVVRILTIACRNAPKRKCQRRETGGRSRIALVLSVFLSLFVSPVSFLFLRKKLRLFALFLSTPIFIKKILYSLSRRRTLSLSLLLSRCTNTRRDSPSREITRCHSGCCGVTSFLPPPLPLPLPHPPE